MSTKRWRDNMSGKYTLYLIVFMILGLLLIKYLQKYKEGNETPVITEQHVTAPENNQNNNTEKEKPQNVIPLEAIEVFQYAMTHGGETKKDYRGNTIFSNRERNLPQTENGVILKYKEYDIHLWIKGQNRGPERVVISSKGTGYYTADHYRTFIKIE